LAGGGAGTGRWLPEVAGWPFQAESSSRPHEGVVRATCLDSLSRGPRWTLVPSRRGATTWSGGACAPRLMSSAS